LTLATTTLQIRESAHPVVTAAPVDAVRRFNRFYTRHIGVLQETLLGSPFSLAEVRILYELANRDTCSAAELVGDLGLDPGYLSRLLAGLSKRKLVNKKHSISDGRRKLLTLSPDGLIAFQLLDAQARTQVCELLAKLSVPDQSRLLSAMRTIERLLNPTPARDAGFRLRTHQPGDMGWVVERHGALYAQAYGYSEEFEALVAEIVAAFLRNFDPARERCWIAEREDQRVGSVLLVAHSKTVAKLRLLLVEPSARGLGLGQRLVAECVRFARQSGYRKVRLWTQSHLTAARRLYEAAGFQRIKDEPHHSFARDLVAETWELDLG
jgi:DNA-binding MarR family transcriptional regulator/GNAT superfamily N-acetyltransferase